MTTKPTHDTTSIAQDAIRLVETAREDLTNKAFAKFVSKRELDVLLANAEALARGVGGRTDVLAAQIGAGSHAADVRASLAEACRAIHAEADLVFEKSEPLRRAFGYGIALDESSTASVEHFAHALLASADAHHKEAAEVHLDKHGVHHLEDLLHALVGADVAHVKAKSKRHDHATELDSLAHLVTAGASHVRYVARRVLRHDEKALARYASTLPRHAIKPRSRHAPEPAPAAKA